MQFWQKRRAWLVAKNVCTFPLVVTLRYFSLLKGSFRGGVKLGALNPISITLAACLPFLPQQTKTNNQKLLELWYFDQLFFRWIIPICFPPIGTKKFGNCNLNLTPFNLSHSFSLLVNLYTPNQISVNSFRCWLHKLRYDNFAELDLKDGHVLVESPVARVG